MTDSQLKYNLIRQRFLDHFYFEGRVAVSVSPGVLGDSIVFGDQTIYLGQALLFFASEIAVLRRSGQDVSGALLRLDELLNGIEELERKGRVTNAMEAVAEQVVFLSETILLDPTTLVLEAGSTP